MRILLLGADGQVGRELARCLAPLGDLEAPGRAGPGGVDLADGDALANRLAEASADWIVNAAAYTAVDQAEAEADLAHAVNGRAVGILAEHAADTGAGLVHYSTDYVFPGDATRPYREDDPVAPVNAYGASKLAGEQAIATAGCRYLLLRTAWVYGNHGRNFLRSILRHARQRDTLRIVDDQHGAPAWSRMLAQLTALAVARVVREGWEGRAGVYHLSARGETTWHGFARRFCDHAVARGLLTRAPELVPIGTDEYPTPARRPSYSVLDNARFESTFGLRVPSWEEQLAWCMDDFAWIDD